MEWIVTVVGVERKCRADTAAADPDGEEGEKSGNEPGDPLADGEGEEAIAEGAELTT